MKVRAGFVSNSSSSSFCILGCNLEEVFDKLKEKALEKNPDLRNPDDPGSVCWELGLKYYPSYDDGKVVGLEAKKTSIDDLLELQMQLVEIIGDGVKFRVIAGEWAD